MNQSDLDVIFTYQPPVDKDGNPDKNKLAAYEAIRAMGKELACTVLRHTSPGYDQGLAIDRIREAVMWANAAVALADKLEQRQPEIT